MNEYKQHMNFIIIDSEHEHTLNIIAKLLNPKTDKKYLKGFLEFNKSTMDLKSLWDEKQRYLDYPAKVIMRDTLTTERPGKYIIFYNYNGNIYWYYKYFILTFYKDMKLVNYLLPENDPYGKNYILV